ncbi:MAG: RES family NAD+ phosphorylase [Blastocatellia bacterium]
MTTVWRISKLRYAQTAYSGEGARREAGRWHAAGDRVVYTSASAALAALEVLVHTDTDLLPRTDFVVIPAEIPSRTKIARLDPSVLPRNWQAIPSPGELREIGARWLRERKAPVLAVPSVVVPFEWNYLLNPEHPAFKTIRIGTPQAFRFDPRLGNP